MDHLGLVEAVDGLGERVVVAVADAADRRLDAGLGQALGVLDRDVLAAAIAVVDEPAAMDRPPIMQSLLQRIEHEARMRRARHPPADDPAGIGIDDEGDVDEAGPGRDIGEVGDPQHVRPRRLELAVDVVQRAWRRLVADRGLDRLAADHALQTHVPHQPRDRAAGDIEAFALELPPDLAHAVDVEVLLEHAPDLDLQGGVPPARGPTRLAGSARLATWAW